MKRETKCVCSMAHTHMTSCPCWGTGAATKAELTVVALRAEVRRLKTQMKRIATGPHGIDKTGHCSARAIAVAALKPKRTR